jgi:hypothetical protein
MGCYIYIYIKNFCFRGPKSFIKKGFLGGPKLGLGPTLGSKGKYLDSTV